MKSGEVWKDMLGNFWRIEAVSRSGKSVRIRQCRANGNTRGCRPNVFTRRASSLAKWGRCRQRGVMQGDIEQLLRDASRVRPHPLLADDPRIGSYGRQLATMLLEQYSERDKER